MQFSSLYIALTQFLASRGIKPDYITGLDSATMVLHATARYLHGKDVTVAPFSPALVGSLANTLGYLPKPLIETIATTSGWMDASSPGILDQVRAETISRWVVEQYPKRQYPAAMIGSSNGSSVYLCTALGIPYLPQTLLIALRRATHPDLASPDVEWARLPAQRLLGHNPDLWIYQMHDPNQDRVKISQVGYFRIKRSRLGETFKQFLKETLTPGATLFLNECQYSWLATKVGDRHLFQFGGTGELLPDEYHQPSQAVADFLERQGSPYRQWQTLTPDGRYPESEWGFEPSLREDVEQFAHENGFQVRRIVYDHPQHLSPFVADFYRWWYQQRGLPGNQLLSESFTYLQPWWVLRLGLVPFWSVFNDQASLHCLNEYLDTVKPYDQIYANLFSNAIDSLGLASIEEWRSPLQKARQHSRFIGVNEHTYPRDFASSIYHKRDLKKIASRYPLPQPLPLHQFDDYLAQRGDRYPIRWLN